MGEAGEPEYLTRDEVDELRARLTMLDVFRARKYPDRTKTGLRAYHETAKRTGLIGPEVTLEEFLVRIRAADFNEVVLPNSPGPGSIGAESQDSSATTGSDPETTSSSPETNTRD